jgi:hypothetical protein
MATKSNGKRRLTAMAYTPFSSLYYQLMNELGECLVVSFLQCIAVHSCTLHSALCTLHSALCTLHSALCTLHSACMSHTFTGDLIDWTRKNSRLLGGQREGDGWFVYPDAPIQRKLRYRFFQIVSLADIYVLCIPLTDCIGCPIRCALCLGCASRADVATTGWILDIGRHGR